MTSVTDASPACPASHPISRMKQRSSIAGLLGLMIATAVTSAAIADTPTHITTREELVAVADNPAGSYALGAAAAVLATEDISDWSHAANYPVDPATGICAPDFYPVPPHMFFRFRLTVED